MENKYLKPELEVIDFEDNDIITASKTSGGNVGGGGSGKGDLGDLILP